MANETATEIYTTDYMKSIKVEKHKEFNPLNYWKKEEKTLNLIAGVTLAALTIYSLGVFLG